MFVFFLYKLDQNFTLFDSSKNWYCIFFYREVFYLEIRNKKYLAWFTINFCLARWTFAMLDLLSKKQASRLCLGMWRLWTAIDIIILYAPTVHLLLWHNNMSPVCYSDSSSTGLHFYSVFGILISEAPVFSIIIFFLMCFQWLWSMVWFNIFQIPFVF